MPRYGKGSHEAVEREMHEYKRGTLRSGSGRKVKSRKQAIAIGLSEARKEGDKVPPPSSRKKASSRKKSTSRKKTSSRKKSASHRAKRGSSARKSTSSRGKRSSSRSR